MTGRRRPDGSEQTMAEMILQINIALVTNPKFVEEEEFQDFYTLVNRKKRKNVFSVFLSFAEFSKRGIIFVG